MVVVENIAYKNRKLFDMEHKGLIYTLSGIAVLAIMIGLVAFGLDSGGARNFILETYPTNANVYLNGKKVGRTPLTLDAEFMRRNHISGYEEAPLLRVFTPKKDGALLISSSFSKNGTTKKPQVMTFALNSKQGNIPQIFDKSKPDAPLEIPQKEIKAFIYFDKADKMIVVFDKDKMPSLLPEQKERANVIWFGSDVSLGMMSEYKSFTKKM